MALVFFGQAHGAALEDLKAFVVDEKTPIIFNEKTNLLVLEGANSVDELKDIQTRSSDFKAASEISTIKPYKPYWLAQKLLSHLKQDRILRLDARYGGSNWVESQHYVLYKDGRVEKLKPRGRGSFSVLAELNPFTEPVNLSNSQYSIFTLPKDEEVLILSRLESASSFPAKSFSIGIFDNGQYLELRRYGLYIEGFHSDNGSEYINHKVAKMLEKLRIEQTKSRSRQSNDNALAESKNASVVRKHMGYSHIPQKYAQPINTFYQEVFNPWLNLHRPCMFATSKVNGKGKVVKVYKHADVKTPLEALVKLNEMGLVRFKTDSMLADLLAQARQQTDLAVAQEMQRAKSALFASFAKQKQRA